MGQNMAGFVRFKVNGDKGQKLTLTHSEVLDKNGNFYRENIRDAAVICPWTIYQCYGDENILREQYEKLD
nr:family 78 glycoside hydrolase catalytic domain [Clostridium estertheticum]